jgi:YesN/AraC family two-component response regulator
MELFKQFSPDIVVTDVNMPVMDGVEMIQEIKRINPMAKCIVLTAYSNKITFERIKDLGVCAYLTKPLDLTELFKAIKKCSAWIKLKY